MKLLLSWLRNNTILSNFLATIIPFLISIVLIRAELIIVGFAFFVIPIFVLGVAHKYSRFFLLIFTFFFQIYWIPLSDYIRVFAIDFILLFLLMLFFFGQFKSQQKTHTTTKIALNELFYPYLIFLCFCIFSTLMNIYRFNDRILLISIWYNLRCLQLLFAILIISNLKLDLITIEKFYNFIIICGLLQFPIGFFQLHSGSVITGTFTEHHSCISAILTIVILLSIYKTYINFKSRNYRKFIFFSVTAILIVYTMYGTGSRSALLGLFICLIIFIFKILFTKKLKFSIVTLSLIMVIGYISYEYTPFKDVLNRSFNSNDSISKIDLSSLSRLLIWKYTWLNFLHFPIITKLFGIGIGTFPFLKQNFVLWNGNQTFAGAHLNPLHVVVETGIFGLISFLYVFFLTIVVFYKNRDHTISKIGFYSTIALLFSGFSQETFWFQPAFGTVWLFYVFVMCLILTHIKLERKLT